MLLPQVYNGSGASVWHQTNYYLTGKTGSTPIIAKVSEGDLDEPFPSERVTCCCKDLDRLRLKSIEKFNHSKDSIVEGRVFQQQNSRNQLEQINETSHLAYAHSHGTGVPEWTADKGNRNLREIFSNPGLRKPVRNIKGGSNSDYCCSGVIPSYNCRRHLDVKFSRETKLSSPSMDSPPSRIAGGTGCNCSYPPSNRQTNCSSERPVEACLPGLHQKYKDFYPDCRESHLPRGYRRFVEHDDLYLPPSRPLSPTSTDHDDLYLPSSRPCSPPSPPQEDWFTPCPLPCAPPTPKICTCKKPRPSASVYMADIYLPESRPCTPAGDDVYLPSTPRCPSPPSRECFGLGRMANEHDDMPMPYTRPPSPTYSDSCRLSPIAVLERDDLHLPSSRPMTPMSVEPIELYLPSSRSPSCSCSPSLSRSPSPSPSPSPCPSPTSSIYIDEIPNPFPGNRYVSCKDCLCHKAESTRNLCPPPQGKTSPCRDCVCHLGALSPSQGGGTGRQTPAKGPTRCPSPSKPRFKLQLNQPACQECTSPSVCKGPAHCNPHYIVETPLSCSPPSRSKSPSPRPKSVGGNCLGAVEFLSPRCQTCDCHKKGGINAISSCSPPKSSSPCSSGCPSPSPSPKPCRPPSPSPKPCRPPSPKPCQIITSCQPCRLPLAAELLSGMEDCFRHVEQVPAPCAASVKPTSTCITPAKPISKASPCDSRCATCECHKVKASPCKPPDPPPCRRSPSPPACKPSTPPACSCPSSPPSPCKPPGPPACSCSSSPSPKSVCPPSPGFKTPSPRCVDCDCHKQPKSKQFKCSTQIKAPTCLSMECDRMDCDCHHHHSNAVQHRPAESTISKKWPQQHLSLDPGPLCAECEAYMPKGTNLVCKLVKHEVPLEPCKFPISWESRRDMQRPPCNPQSLASEIPEKKSYDQCAPKPAKLETQSSAFSNWEPSSRVPRPTSPQQVTRRCCCGKCTCTDPRCFITTTCPFCAHVHSCCCGMCCCPIPTCSSKSPIPDSCRPTLMSPKNSSAARKGDPRTCHPRLRSPSPISQNIFSKGANTPVKAAQASKSPMVKTKLQSLDPKSRFPSPRTQMKSFNNFLKSQSRRQLHNTTPEPRRSSQRCASRRSQLPTYCSTVQFRSQSTPKARTGSTQSCRL